MCHPGYTSGCVRVYHPGYTSGCERDGYSHLGIPQGVRHGYSHLGIPQGVCSSLSTRFTVGRGFSSFLVSLLVDSRFPCATRLSVAGLGAIPDPFHCWVYSRFTVGGQFPLLLSRFTVGHTPSLSALNLIMWNIPDSGDVRIAARLIFPECQKP